METLKAADRLAALGHQSRLQIFRLLVQAGPSGVNAGLIGATLGFPPATCSFHLAHLARVGLVAARQEGRFIFYTADFAAMDDLIAFLTDDCCNGEACLPKTVAINATTKSRPRKCG